jgi:hypothetical protein
MNAQLLEFSAHPSPAAGAIRMRPRDPAFPAEAVAVIYRPSRSVMSSAPQRRRSWQLTFEAHTAPEIEPLMGWTTSADPLTQVRLSFPTLEAAIAYARRQGLSYRISGTPEGAGVIMPAGDSAVAEEHAPPRIAA